MISFETVHRHSLIQYAFRWMMSCWIKEKRNQAFYAVCSNKQTWKFSFGCGICCGWLVLAFGWARVWKSANVDNPCAAVPCGNASRLLHLQPVLSRSVLSLRSRLDLWRLQSSAMFSLIALLLHCVYNLPTNHCQSELKWKSNCLTLYTFLQGRKLFTSSSDGLSSYLWEVLMWKCHCSEGRLLQKKLAKRISETEYLWHQRQAACLLNEVTLAEGRTYRLIKHLLLI